jgi:hypothetical protein
LPSTLIATHAAMMTTQSKAPTMLILDCELKFERVGDPDRADSERGKGRNDG